MPAAVIAGVEPGHRVRVFTADSTFWGRLVRTTPGGFTVSTPLPPGERAVLFDDVRRLAVQDGVHVGRGALIGGSVGAVLMASMGVGFGGALGPGIPGCSRLCYAARGAAGGAVAGLGVGIVVGALFPKWRTVYP
jgi:hypothetical protein